MFHDGSFQETNKTFNRQEVNFENVTGMFRDGRSLVDLTITSKRTKFDYLFCPLLDLLRHPSLFNWVVQPMHNEQLVNGITVKFYHGGEWIDIDTDSTLPRQIGTRARGGDNNQWVGLVEKAYAKLYDTYANLTTGLTAHTMSDLTGGIGIHNRLDGISWGQLKKIEDGRSKTLEDLFYLLMTDECDKNEPQRKLNAEFILTSGVADNKKPGVDLHGLKVNNQYTLLQFKMANKDDGKEEMFVRLWSPYGTGKWTGTYSSVVNTASDYESWSNIVKRDREEMFSVTESANPSFWMSFADWVTHMDYFDICALPTKLSDSGEPYHSVEKRRNGFFQGHSDTVKLKLSIGARRNIFVQTLLDTPASYSMSPFCCKLLVKDRLGKIIRPRLPLQYPETDGRGYWTDKSGKMLKYCQNGYLYNLKAGDYELVFSAVHSSTLQTIADGTKWIIRAVAKSSTLKLRNFAD